MRHVLIDVSGPFSGPAKGSEKMGIVRQEPAAGVSVIWSELLAQLASIWAARAQASLSAFTHTSQTAL